MPNDSQSAVNLPVSPMDFLYRAFSTFHGLGMIERRDGDELYQLALSDLKQGIDQLRAETIG